MTGTYQALLIGLFDPATQMGAPVREKVELLAFSDADHTFMETDALRDTAFDGNRSCSAYMGMPSCHQH
jgi:hypothetical protein